MPWQDDDRNSLFVNAYPSYFFLCNVSSVLFKIKYDRQMLPVYFQSNDMLGRKGELHHYETRHKDQRISSRFITE